MLFWSPLFAIGAAKQGREATTDELKVKDGSHIVYDDLGSGAPTLVFIHCWSCNRHYWKDSVSELSEDHRLVLIDLPGHGDSKAGKRPPITVNAMAKDVREGLKSVAAGANPMDIKRGIDQAVLVVVEDLKKLSKPFPPDQ